MAQGKLTGAERQKLHLQCESCLRAVCEYRQSLLGLSLQRETTGVWTLSLRCLRVVVNEVQEKAYEVCRCASNCIQVDGAASKGSNGA